MKKISIYIFITVFIFGCGKNFLDIPRDANQVIPQTVQDYKAVISNSRMLGSSLDLAFLGADEYYIKNRAELVAGSAYTPFHQFAYLWSDDIFGDSEVLLWQRAYERIMYANLALDVEKLIPDGSESEDHKQTIVSSYFHRAFNYYQLAQQFCDVYDRNSENSNAGLPLRLDYDISIDYDFATVAEVYDQILSDLHRAESLGETKSQDIYLPGTYAVWALLSRVYLQMGNYQESLRYANLVLERNKVLLDYNQLEADITSVYDSYFEPYGKNNPSIIYYSYGSVGGLLSANRMNVDTSFIAEFDEADLRAKVYFFNRPDGTAAYIGSYCGFGANEPFTGLTVEEMLLNRSECNARIGSLNDARSDLNYLLKHRYSKYLLGDLNISNKEELLTSILDHRKKELYMRGLRWEDVRRLNREGNPKTTFVRKFEGQTYELSAGSSKWVWKYPKSETTINSLTSIK